MTPRSPFRYFQTSPEVIRLVVMLYVRFPLSLRFVEDLLHERGIDICHENRPPVVDALHPTQPRRAERNQQLLRRWWLGQRWSQEFGPVAKLWRLTKD